MSDSVNMISAVGGELITYIAEGRERTLRAVVKRRPTQVSLGNLPHLVKLLDVWIARDAMDGLMQINERLDEVECFFNLQDAAPTRFRVMKILEQDAGLTPSDGGMWRLEAQA